MKTGELIVENNIYHSSLIANHRKELPYKSKVCGIQYFRTQSSFFFDTIIIIFSKIPIEIFGKGIYRN